MRKQQFIISILILILLIFSFTQARNDLNKSNRTLINKTDATNPHNTLSNINNWSYWLQYDGKSAFNPYTDGAGAVYPRGTATAIYIDGIVWGSIVDDPDTTKPKLRVGGQTYSTGTQPLSDHIYRIRKNWVQLNTSNVAEETAEFFNIPIESVTESQANEVIDQYKNDWKNWPVDQGAPYVDVDENGSYNPILDTDGMPDPSLGDYPGISNADQVVWFKVDDQNETLTLNLYGSFPMGVELQVTVWGFNQQNSRLGQAIFKKYKIKNISSFSFNDMYLSQWSDPDLGDYSDDLAGCDSLLECAFVYNGKAIDSEFEKYGIAPSAISYALLQGPIVPSTGDTALYNGEKLPGYKNLSMNSFGYFGTGTLWTDPDIGNYVGALQWYNLLRGYAPTTEIGPTMFIHMTEPNAGEETKFPLNGDPVSASFPGKVKVVTLYLLSNL